MNKNRNRPAAAIRHQAHTQAANGIGAPHRISTLSLTVAAALAMLPMAQAHADNFAFGSETPTTVVTLGGASAAPTASTGGGFPAIAGSDGTSQNQAYGVATQASGGAALSIGDTVTATGRNATSVGSNSSATGANAVALGGGAVANGSGSLALGGAAAVTGTNNTVVGAQANANGTGLVAIGQGATANTSGSVAIGQTSSANGQNGVAVGWSASAGGSNSVAIGQSASATRAGDVAIGVGSVDAAPNPTANATIGTTTFSSFAGSAPTSVFSIGSIGNERQLTNVAAGRITANSTDAVNGSELFAVASQVATLSTSFTSLTQQLAASAATTQLLGGTATGANSTAVGSSSTATAANSTAVGQAAQAVGVNSTAIGTNTSATGTNTLANGNGAVASGDNSTALGANAHASAANSVALGAGSVADQANTVSVGSPGNERRVTNVAAGINPTDAVNMSQLQGVQASVNSVARRAYSGVAGAVALSMIPDVDAGKTIAVGVGTGGFQGYGAVALGFTARINGNIKIRAGASTSSAGSTYGGGVSYQW